MSCLGASDVSGSIAAWRGILKDTISLTAGGNKLKINLYVPPSPGKYPEGHAPLFTNQKKLLFRYHESRESLSGSALDPESYRLLPPTYMSIINVKDEHSTAKSYISAATASQMCTDTAWFIKNKHHILLQCCSTNVIIPVAVHIGTQRM